MGQERCRRENLGGSPYRNIEVSGRTEIVLCATGQVMGCPIQEKELGTCFTGVTSGRYLCSSEGILDNEGEAEHLFLKKTTVASHVKTTVSGGQGQFLGCVISAVE